MVDCNKAIKESAILACPVDHLNITMSENKRLQNSLALLFKSIWEYRFRAKWSTMAQRASGGYKDYEY